MCEMLACSLAEARPFGDLAERAALLEDYGLAGFGWGVAWLDGDGAVRGKRGLGRFRQQALDDDALLRTASRRFLVHLRRPNLLSTIQMADTQPFFDGTRSAWCHNGYLERADNLRDRYTGRLSGRADSEVGWQYFLDKVSEGAGTLEALSDVDEAFGGKVNLGVLRASGELSLYSRNATNRMWRFRLGSTRLGARSAHSSLDGAELVSTGLHSDDESLFELAFPDASEKTCLEQGTAVTLADATAAAA